MSDRMSKENNRIPVENTPPSAMEEAGEKKPFRAVWLMRNANQVGKTVRQLKLLIEDWIEMGMPALSRIEVLSAEDLKILDQCASLRSENASLKKQVEELRGEVKKAHDAQLSLFYVGEKARESARKEFDEKTHLGAQLLSSQEECERLRAALEGKPE